MRKLMSITLSIFILLTACPICFGEADYSNVQFEDPGRLADEDFFGQWDGEKWVIESQINYDYTNALKTVEEAVKAGDYYKAKEDLLYYYRNRGLEQPLSTTRDPLSAKVQAKDINYSQAPVVAAFAVSETPQWYEIDVTNHITLGGSAVYTLHMLDRDFGDEGTEGIVSFQAKESGENVSYLEVEQGGQTYTIPCGADMYIRGGRYSSFNYGDENQILVSEWQPYEGIALEEGESPASNGTRQAHIRYSTSGLDSTLPIDRATLKLYGSSTVEGKEIGIFQSTITTAWNEREITWFLYPNQIYSYQGIAGGYVWKNPSAAHQQFYNVQNRLGNLAQFFTEARETNNPVYEIKAIELFLDYIRDVNGLTNDWYSSEKRLNSAFRNNGNSQECFFSALHTKSLDPIAFGALIKLMWQEADAMSGPPMEGQINLNGLSSVVGSLLRFCTYFPEFAKRNHYIEKAQTRMIEMAEQCLFEDGSYREASSGYDASVLGDINAFYDIVKDGDVELPEEFKEYYRAFAISQMNLTQPNKEQFRWGDGGIKRDMRERILAAANNLDDMEMLYYGTDGEEGTLPNYTSYFAPAGKMGVMRSDWTDRGVSAFIIGRIGGSHSHHDMNHINLYAYDRILLNDTGKASYDSRHPAVAWQSNRSESHNTVEVNDHGQDMAGGMSMYDDSTVSMYMNSKMDYYSGESNAYPLEAVHTRKLSFVRDKKFYIVTDFMENLNGQENKYNQVWHIPDQKRYYDINPESKTVMTNYTSGANLSVVPVNPARLTSAGLASNVLGRSHVSYVINSADNTYFNTILFPFENEAQDIKTQELPVTGVTDNSATAFSMVLPSGEDAVYYANNDLKQIHRFDRFDVDAGMFYAERGDDGALQMFSANEVKTVKENSNPILQANRRLTDVAVRYSDKFLELDCSDEIDLSQDYIMVAAPEKTEVVTLNQEVVPFFRLNGNIVVGTYSENLRYRIEGSEAVAELPGMTVSFPVSENKDISWITAEIKENSTLRTEKSWNGKMELSSMEESNLSVGNWTIGESKFLEGTVDIPIRFAFEGNPDWRAAPVINGRPAEPEEKLSEDSLDAAMNLEKDTAYYSDESNASVYSKQLGRFVFYSEKADKRPTDSGGNAPNSGHVSSGGGTVSPIVTPTPPPTVTPNPPEEMPFDDIASHWAKNDIISMYERGIVNGDEGKFAPDRPINRAETAAMLVRAADIPVNSEYKGIFADVLETEWYSGVIEAAAEKGIVSGNGNGFEPMEAITRAQLCKMVMNTFKQMGGTVSEGGESGFADKELFPQWAEVEIANAVSLGFVKGYPDNTFRADGLATRAEVTAVINRMIKKIEE